MLDSLRKKDSSNRPAPAAPMSPYQRMSEALSPAPGSASAGHASPATEAKSESRDAKTDPAAADTRVTASSPSTSVWGGASPSSTTSTSGEESVSRLIVGPDIKLKGAEITDCDTLVVEGRVEAAMDSRVIQIAEVGTFVGKAGVDTAEIRGHFEGELTARKQLIIRAGGRVTGKIRYGKVSIEEGGELSGDVGSLTSGTGSASNGVTLQAARH